MTGQTPIPGSLGGTAPINKEKILYIPENGGVLKSRSGGVKEIYIPASVLNGMSNAIAGRATPANLPRVLPEGVDAKAFENLAGAGIAAAVGTGLITVATAEIIAVAVTGVVVYEKVVRPGVNP